MKIALIGYGKMGKAIEAIIARENKHQIVLKISQQNLNDFTVENLKKADVAIEFTQPASAYQNILTCFEAKIPVVIGTTAWMEHLESIKSKCTHEDNTCMVASNYSIGVNLFFELNKKLATMMASHPEYKIRFQEIHHLQKKDAPSGTAVSLANDILVSLGKTGWELQTSDRATDPSKIPIEALREPEVPGTHSIFYTSNVDEIEIKHTAKSRDGFAIGAIRAAEFIADKKGFFTMEDMIHL